MLKIPVPNYVDFLVKRKFPELRPPVPPLMKTMANNGIVYDHDEEPYTPPPEKILKKAESYKTKLKGMPKQELKTLYQEELDKQNQEDDERRFFNQKNTHADFDYWSKMSEWSMEEAIALSFSKNPEIVTVKRIEGVLSYTSPFVEKYLKLKELAIRAKKANNFTDASIPMPNDPIRPYKYVEWIQRNNLDFPPELADKVSRVHITNKPPKSDLEKAMERLERASRPSPFEKGIEQLKVSAKRVAEKERAQKPKPLLTREKETLLKIIIGMAIDAYGYDPRATRSPFPKELEGILGGLDISVSDDTIRDKLKEAMELLPQTPEKPNY